ncbi:MAG: hypothetical protein WAZ12_02120 [Candidatus Absconditicoccaceae bacterium]
MRRLKFIIFGLIMFMGINVGNIFAIDIQVPSSQGNEDIIVTGPSQIHTDESTIFEIIQLINQYLRFSIGLICLIVLVIAGFKLISAEGDASKTKKANSILSGAIIGIIICMLSYAAVRIIVNLFS